MVLAWSRAAAGRPCRVCPVTLERWWFGGPVKGLVLCAAVAVCIRQTLGSVQPENGEICMVCVCVCVPSANVRTLCVRALWLCMFKWGRQSDSKQTLNANYTFKPSPASCPAHRWDFWRNLAEMMRLCVCVCLMERDTSAARRKGIEKENSRKSKLSHIVHLNCLYRGVLESCYISHTTGSYSTCINGLHHTLVACSL